MYYDNGNDYEDEYNDHDYELEYEEGSLSALYDLCLVPTLEHTIKHLIPLITASLIFKVVAQSSKSKISIYNHKIAPI